MKSNVPTPAKPSIPDESTLRSPAWVRNCAARVIENHRRDIASDDVPRASRQRQRQPPGSASEIENAVVSVTPVADERLIAGRSVAGDHLQAG